MGNILQMYIQNETPVNCKLALNLNLLLFVATSCNTTFLAGSHNLSLRWFEIDY